jgi:hypothetical protein
VIDPATGQLDTYPRYEGPLAALLPFADGVLARTTNARKKDIVALLNVVDGAIRVAGEVEVNCDGLVAVPELPVAIGYTDRGLWCIAWHAGALHLSAKMSVRAESVATHGGVVRVRDDKGGVHEVCGISAWVSSLG